MLTETCDVLPRWNETPWSLRYVGLASSQPTIHSSAAEHLNTLLNGHALGAHQPLPPSEKLTTPGEIPIAWSVAFASWPASPSWQPQEYSRNARHGLQEAHASRQPQHPQRVFSRYFPPDPRASASDSNSRVSSTPRKLMRNLFHKGR